MGKHNDGFTSIRNKTEISSYIALQNCYNTNMTIPLIHLSVTNILQYIFSVYNEL